MKVFDNSWRTFAVRTVVFSAAVFGAMRLAVARDGVAGGPARSFVTVAGTLTGVSGASPATFEFRRAGSPSVLCAPQVTITPGAGGAFSVPVPLDQPELSTMARCPEDLFDGRDVQVRVLIGGNEVATWASINPVPYAHFASVAGQVGVDNDCPAGYQRDTSDSTITTTMRLCVRMVAGGRDEVVRVGSGASAFWIDRHEASVWNAAGQQFGASSDTYPNLLKNGQWYTSTIATPPLRAVSRSGVLPSRFITWFQANEVCRAAGKRLPTGDEWLAAAQGTTDPSTGNDGTQTGNSRCNTMGPSMRNTGLGGAGCFSAWGAQDMIGNAWEWTAEWYAGVGDNNPMYAALPNSSTMWRERDLYNDDRTYNIASRALAGSPMAGEVSLPGTPSATLRGGAYLDVSGAGIFAMGLHLAPSRPFEGGGFRCVVLK